MSKCKACQKNTTINENGYCQTCQDKENSTYEELSAIKNLPVDKSVTDNPEMVEEVDNSDAFLYAMSFLLPIIGIISGSILLTTDNKKSIGRDCIVASLVGVLIAGLIIIGIKAS